MTDRFDSSSQWPQFQQKSIDEWKSSAAKSSPNKDSDELGWKTPDNIFLKALYTKEDTKNLPFVDTLPGFEPFIRGPQATMYAARPWTIRQYAGFSTAEESNAF